MALAGGGTIPAPIAPADCNVLSLKLRELVGDREEHVERRDARYDE